MIQALPFLLFLLVCMVIMLGYPVALSLAGTSLIFAFVAAAFGAFDLAFLQAFPNRLYGIMSNQILVAVPLFILMGVILEKSRIAEDLLKSMATVFGRFKGGLAISVTVVGMLLAASTGIVGATVVAMGLISLPSMLKQGYKPSLAAGTICATGTLGQIIPPSMALIILGDVLSSAFQQAQLKMGIFSPETVSVGDLFVGAIIPGLLLVVLYILYLIIVTHLPSSIENAHPSDNTDEENGSAQENSDTKNINWANTLTSLFPPLILIITVLGSIIGGIATPTEGAGVGAIGALIIALVKGQLSLSTLRASVIETTRVTSMVFLIFIGAAIFSLVFRGLGGDEAIHAVFEQMPGGVVGATLIVMLTIFLLGFVLDFIEITFVVVPIVAPVLFMMGLDPVWLGIMIAINLQTSFLTPPFGFALFYLRGVAPPTVKTSEIYRGVIPFIVIQIVVMLMLALWPSLATWLPTVVYQ